LWQVECLVLWEKPKKSRLKTVHVRSNCNNILSKQQHQYQPRFRTQQQDPTLEKQCTKELATQYNKTSESDHCQIFILRKTTLRKHPRGLELLEPSMAEEAPKKTPRKMLLIKRMKKNPEQSVTVTASYNVCSMLVSQRT